MSEPIGPGDWVECIRANGLAEGALVVGGLYRVQEVKVDTLGRFVVNVGVVVQDFLGIRVGFWCHTRFRPIRRRRAEFPTDLLASIEQELEPA